MKSNKPAPERKPASGDPKPPQSSLNQPLSPLNLTPEQARREAGKLHELGEDLENRKKVEDTSARTSPLGRAE